MAHPFLIFPAEIWEIILNKLDDSEDVFSAFKAYPELEAEGILKRKRHLWLFDQVVPCIYSYISEKDLLSSRQVCQQWCHGTNKFIENHPTRRPFIQIQDTQVTAQHFIPQAMQAKHHLWKPVPERKPFISLEMFDEFFQHIEKHPTNMNPFLGRAVLISDEKMSNKMKQTCFWNRAFEFLCKFGKHIWFLGINYVVVSDQIQFFQDLRNILGFVPNLKGIRIDSKFKANFDLRKFQSFLEANQPLFPSLPHLETLEVDAYGLSSALGYFLLTDYSKQLRRLSISHSFWREEYCRLLPKLVEFNVDGISTKSGASELLFSLDAPELSKLELIMSSDDPSMVIDIGNDLVPWLKGFPKIRSLLINSQKYSFTSDSESSTSITHIIPSLQSLIIVSGMEIDSKFLRCFPSLEYLFIYYNTIMSGGLFGGEGRYDSAIWEKLPRLSEMAMSCWFESTVYATREGYNSWKKNVNQGEHNV